MLRYEAESTADPDVAWALLARPGRWHEWAPHVRGAWGLDDEDGQVRRGALGAARLLGAVPVPARIVDVVPNRSWSWRVGPVLMDHRVEPRPGGGGCVVAIELQARPPVEALLRASYGPVVGALVARLARLSSRPTG
jgi:hypothetical protein